VFDLPAVMLAANGRWRFTALKSIGPQVALLVASLLFMALMGEVALRVAVGPPIIWLHPQESYEPDAEMGHRLTPGQTSYTHDKSFTTNSIGIRAPDVSRHAPKGTRRLLALGDSQTAGDGLLLEDTWPSQLARELEKVHPATRLQVLNGGLSGTSPWQYVILLQRLSEVYDFDGVVIALYVNDVTPRTKSIEASVVTNSLARSVGYVLKRSALFTAIWRARQPLSAALRSGEGTNRETRIINGDEDPLVELGWQDLEASLREMRSFTREREIDLWVLILPRRDQVDGSEPGRAYNQRSAEISARLGIPHVDVLEPLIAEYSSTGRRLFITWDGHNSTLANRVVTREVARIIEPKP
jgi:hypothetical protein